MANAQCRMPKTLVRLAFGIRHSALTIMDPGFRSPLIDFFRRGEVTRDVRLLAAQGALAPRAQEQLALLVLLSDDPDPAIRRAVADTLEALPIEPLRAFLARPAVPPEMLNSFPTLAADPPTHPPLPLPPAHFP